MARKLRIVYKPLLSNLFTVPEATSNTELRAGKKGCETSKKTHESG